MTREESFELLDNEYHVDMNEYRSVDEFLNIIYNDFESRTCENCKYRKAMENVNMGGRFIVYGCNMYVCFSHITGLPKDFGCNKFERKTDE